MSRIIRSPIPIPDYGELMTKQDFINNVMLAAYTDYDGSGYYANATSYFRDVPAIPSEIYTGKIVTGPDITHVVWFNK